MKVLITGGNKGIGYNIARHLLESNKVSEIWITSRTLKNAEISSQKLIQDNQNAKVHPFELDYLNEDSRKKFYNFLDENKNLFDTIVLNSGFAVSGNDTSKKVFELTMQTNYHYTVEIAEYILSKEILKPKGTLVFTSSTVGKLNRVKDKEMHKELSAYKTDLTEERLYEIVQQHEQEFYDLEKQKKWPNSIYAMSKLFLSIKIYLLQKRYQQYNLYGFCPGWCKTELSPGCQNAPLDPYDGAKTATDVLFNIEKPNGEFYYQSKLTSIEQFIQIQNLIQFQKKFSKFNEDSNSNIFGYFVQFNPYVNDQYGDFLNQFQDLENRDIQNIGVDAIDDFGYNGFNTYNFNNYVPLHYGLFSEQEVQAAMQQSVQNYERTLLPRRLRRRVRRYNNRFSRRAPAVYQDWYGLSRYYPTGYNSYRVF